MPRAKRQQQSARLLFALRSVPLAALALLAVLWALPFIARIEAAPSAGDSSRIGNHSSRFSWLGDNDDIFRKILGSRYKSRLTTNVTPFVSTTLVINEIDYDQVDADTAEFIELKNISGGTINLDLYTVELVNGNVGGAVLYGTTVDLPNVNLAAGDYYVICANAATVINCDLDHTPNADMIQNGSPDAVGLRLSGTLVDAVSYEGNTGAPYTENTGTPLATGSDSNTVAFIGLSRFGDGIDSDSNSADVVLRCITPGYANTPNSTGCTAAVISPPSIQKLFGTSPIIVGGSSMMTLSVTNPNFGTTLTGIAFSDTLPTGLSFNGDFSAPLCGGTISVVGATISLTGGVEGPTSGDCNISLPVNANGAATGLLTNTTSAVTSTNGGTGNTASANITVNPAGNAISGTVFNDKGTTNIGAGKTVKLFVAGGSPQTTTTNGSGQYSFSSVSFQANDIITVFISGSTEKGATVTLAPGSVADITGLDIFRDSLIVRHENAGPMTNSFLDTADPGDADLNAIYTATGGTLTVSSGKELRVVAGKTFAPGFLSTPGNVTTHDLVNAGTLSAGSGTLTIQGAFTNTGTFNRETSTVFYDGTAQTITAVNYYNLTFSNNAKTLASSGTIGIAGTFTPGTNTSHTTTNSTIEFNGTSAQAVPVFHTYNNLTLNNTAGTTGASGLKVNETLTVQSGTFTSASDYHHVVINVGGTLTLSAPITVSGDWTNNGAFSPNGFLVSFDGTGAQTITTGGTGAGKTFAAFEVIKSSGTATLAGDLRALTVNTTSGTFNQGASFSVTTTTSGVAASVGANGIWQNFGTGDLTLSGDLTNSGTINFNANGTTCADADDITIASTGGQKTWTGTGTFSMTDVTVSNQSAGVPPVTILVNSGTNAGSNTGWTFVDQCTAGTYTWIGGTLGANTDWQVSTNWNPTRVTPAVGDILIFDGSSTPAPTVTNVPTQTISSLQLKNNVNAASLNASAVAPPHTLTITGNAGLSVASGSRLELAGSDGLTVAVTAGTGSTINGQINLKGGPHRLTGANTGQITFPSGAIFAAGTSSPSSGFSGHPFGQGTDDSVRFQDGSNAFFNEGLDPFGGSGEAIATFTSASTQEFNTSTAWSAGGRFYGNLNLTGNQTYFDSGATSPVTVAGNLTVANGSTLKLSDNAGGDLNVGGNLSINATGVYTHNGRTLTFNGSSTQTWSDSTSAQNFGTVVVNKSSGVVIVAGTVNVTSLTVTAGSLGGAGTVVGPITVSSGGTIAPGLSPAILNTGNVSFNSGSNFNVEINGTTAGTGHDQLNVTGTVSLGGATLNLSGTHTPVVGDTFTIIANDSTDAVTPPFTMGTGGTDSNGGTLAEGDTITSFLGNASFNATITYIGNGAPGNDVVLTVVAACTPPATVYVDDDWVSTTPGTDPDAGAGPAVNFGCDSFATIQDGINGVATGGTVIVAAGSYIENPSVSRAMSIRGAQYGVDARTRVASESIVRTNGNQTAVFGVTAANVTIDGFTIDGDDPGITGIALASGDDTNSSYGVRPTTVAVNNLNVSNNIIKRVQIGVRGDTASQGNVINQNLFDGIGHFDFGYSVSIRNNFYADITNNKMTRTWTGVHINNHNGATGPATFSVTGNEINAYAGGILYWLQYNGATGATISGNTITAQSGAVANNFGVLMVSIQNAVNPSFTSNSITGHNYGIGLFNVPTTSTITLGATNSISNSSLAGVFLTDNLNFNPIGTTNFLAGGPGAASTVNVTGMSITGNTGDGLKVEGLTNSQNIVASGNTVTGTSGTNGVGITGPTATANLSGNNITGFATGLAFVNNGGTTQTMSGSFNRIISTTNAFSVAGTGTFNNTIENNWWGCNAGPGNSGCGAISGTPTGVDFDPWVVLLVSASPSSITPGGTSTVTADMSRNSTAGNPAHGGAATLPLPDAAFSATNGTMSPTPVPFASGIAQSTFTSTSISNGSACADVDNQQTCATITVTAPSFTIDDVTMAEGNGGPGSTSFIFTITKTGATAFNASVDYETVNGSATAPTDFTAIPVTNVTFLPSETTKQVTVFVNGELAVEPDETFTLQLSNASGATIGDASGTGTIQNDDACLPQATVYVDDSWVGTPLGTDPDGGGLATNFGCDSFATIQGGVDGVAVGGTVIVNSGTYDEDVNVNKDGLQVLGAGAGSTNIRGPIGGPGTTVQISANNVTVAGFTITRLGNNTTDWNNPGLNSAGFAIQGLSITGALIRDNVITGTRTGIDINASGDHTVRNNVIDFNRTGMILRNQTDSLTVTENFITNNWTVGIVFLDASGGSNVPIQQALSSIFFNNNISANWYGQIVERQTGGSLPAPATTNFKDFRGNWFGTTSPVVTTANSAEPGYAAQIPVLYGGTATPPGGQPDIAGPASANIRYIPLLQSGTDTDIETTPGRGTNGFQGAGAGNIIVRSNKLEGWVPTQSGTATTTFVVGPATPPLGEGSGQLSVGSNGASAAQFRQTTYNGTLLSDLTRLTYSTYTSNDGTVPMTGDQTIYIILNVDFNGDGTQDTQLFFEPEYQHGYTGAVPDQGDNVLNTWQNWDALAGGWWSTTGVAGAGPGANVKPLSAIIAAQPNARLLNSATTGSLRLVAGFGAGSWDNFVGNVDNVSVGVNTANLTYDFEPLPRISIDDVTQNEANAGQTSYTFNVTLSGPGDQIITVNYQTADDSATTGDLDYTGVASTGITFNPGETTKPVTVLVNGDTKFEITEQFFVNLSGAVNATILDGQGVGTITNDDTQPTISIDNVPAFEGDSGTTDFNFTVSLSNASYQTITVTAQTANGTATTADSDYNGVGATVLTFTPGMTAQPFQVQANGDTKYEHDETFVVDLSLPSNATIADAQGTGTISNDDAAPTLSINDLTATEGTSAVPPLTKQFNFTVTKSGSTGVQATVNYQTVDDTGGTNPATSGADCSTAGVDYIATSGTVIFPANGAGSTSQTVTVLVCRDSAFETPETFLVSLSGQVDATIADGQAVGTITNDDVPAGGFVVNTTADTIDDNLCLPIGSGNGCTLREAINAANASPAATGINFAIPANDARHFYYKDDGVANQVTNDLAHVLVTTAANDAALPVDKDPDWPHSWWSILPASALPALTQATVVDGYTQTDASVNTSSTSTNAVLRIEVEGSSAGAAVTGLVVSNGLSTVRGLVINRFTDHGLQSSGAVTGNFIGTDVSGTLDLGNTGSGVLGGNNMTIGGDTPQLANLISGNDAHGILFTNFNSSVVQGNYIGTKAGGLSALGNSGNGIHLTGGSAVFNTIGGTAAGEANTIAFNGNDGVSLPDAGIGNRIRGNSIFSNGTTVAHLGIDLGPIDGLTANDVAPDSDSGPNALQNFPVIQSAVVGSPNLIAGTLNSAANQTFTIDLYSNPACDASGNGEGKTYLGSTTTTTDSNGLGGWRFSPATLNLSDQITATATSVASNTSEFSQCFTPRAFAAGQLQFVQTTITDPETNAGSHPITFTVQRTGGSDRAASVTYTISGTATTADFDYSVSSATGTLQWPNGDMTDRTITITVNGDTKFETDETVQVVLSSPVGASINGPNTATLTITNDDTQPTISIDNVPLNEGNAGTTNFNFTVSLSNQSYQTITVNAQTAPGPVVTANVDYNSVGSTTLTFTPNTSTQNFQVQVNGDTAFESDETFFVNLSGETNATIADNQGVGTITNDDVCVPPSTVYVDDDWVGTTIGVDPDAGGPATAFGCDAFATIQGGIDGVQSGGNVIVSAGTYAENVLVNKSVTLSGPNAAIDPNTGVRVAEAIVLPAATQVEPTTSGTVFRVGTISGHIDVTIKGFKIDGHNASLTGGRMLNGVEVHTGAGIITSTGSFDDETSGYDTTLIVTNNIIQNLERYGVYISGVNSGTQVLAGNDVSHNKIDNLPSGNNFGGGRGRGIAFGWDVYGSATFNKLTRVNVGWQDDNHYQASTGAATLVSNNEIRAYHRGIFHNLQYGTASTATISDNNLFVETNGDFPASNANFGIELSSIQNAVDVIVTNNNSTGNVYGILLWNLPTTATITISGGTLTNNKYGIYATNEDPQFGAVSTATSAQVSGVSIAGATSVGIEVVDSTAGGATGTVALEVSGDTSMSNSVVGVLVAGVNASANIHDNSASIHGNIIGIAVNTGSATITSNNLYNNGTSLDLANAPTVTAHFNRFISNTTAINNPGNATVDLEKNWWGCNAGPGNSGCGAVNGTGADFDPWIVLGVTASPTSVTPGGSSTITADMTDTSAGADTITTVPLPNASFTATNGTMSPTSNSFTSGQSQSTFTSTSSSAGSGCATVDNQLVCAAVSVTLPSFSISDATPQFEGNAGTTSFSFTVTKTGPGAASVNFQTQNGSATLVNNDYQSSSSTLTFGSADTTQTITVLVNGDTTAEVDETFNVILSSPTDATISDGTGVGTILNDDESVSAGQLIISEFRLSGPGANPAEQANNEFVELYNATDQDLLVTTTDGSAGWAVATSSGVAVFHVPNGTIIPARGHFLGTNTSGYSLNTYPAGDGTFATGDATWTTDVPDNTALALFRTNNAANFNTTNRLDSVGPNTETNTLYREGTGYAPLAPADLAQNLEHTFFRQICVFQAGCPTPGRPRDTQDNAADFIFADTIGAATSAGQRLGSPGPENLSSPIKRDPAVNLVFLDATVSDAGAPNRDRNTTSDSANASLFGTMTIRRRVINETGAPVTRLRFRVIDMTMDPSGPLADLRLRSSSDHSIGSVNDPNTCASTGTPSSPACTVTVKGLTLEQPPNVSAANGGGLNSTVTLPLPGGLPAGQSINVNFLLGVQKTGTFRFYLVVEALP